MNKRIIAIVLVVALVLGICATGSAAALRASTTITSASIYLSSSMKATFTCMCTGLNNITVKSVKLEVQAANGTWSTASSLPAPAGATNALSLNVSKDYSSYCTKGKTYRITATFEAGASSVSRTSSAVTY